jgi:hypothetical protein
MDKRRHIRDPTSQACPGCDVTGEHTREDEPAELLTTAEVAGLFRVARSTVISWAYRGLLPYTTTPTGHLRFYRASIERRLAERNE